MPDLLTHLCSAQIARKTFKLKFFPVFALGVILPDLLSRPFHIIFPAVYWYVVPLHSPLVCVMYCFLISRLFAKQIRKAVFLYLSGGVGLHLFLDLFQKQISPHYFWFFPFSWKSYWVGLFWPGQALFFLPVTVGVTILITYLFRKGG
jgi:hypothetical protein